MSLSLGVFVRARQTDAMITGGFSILDGAVRAGSVIAVRQVVGAKRVVEWAGITEASGSHAEADVLRKEARCNAYRKRRHVRIHGRAILSCMLDVRGVVKETLPIKGDSPEVKLTIATHARPPRPDNVGTPGGIAHLPALEGVYGDASIDYRDEIRVGQRVEHGSWPGAVDAAEDQIVIECQPQSFKFTDGPVRNLDTAPVRSRCCRCFPAGNVYLGPSQARVAGSCAYKAIQVVDFNDVKVHHGQPAQPGCRETNKDIEPDATSPHDEDFPPDEIGLLLLAPGAHGPGLTAAGLWRRLDCVVPGHRELVADDSNVRTVSAIDRSADANIPVASRPCAVPCGKGHANQRESREFTDEVGVTGLAITVRSTHWLPVAGARVAVKQDQPAVIFLGCFGSPQDVIGGNGGISVDESLPGLRRDNRADQSAEAGEPGGRPVRGKTKVFLTVVTNQQADERLLSRRSHGH